MEGSYDFRKIEKEMLEFWKDRQIHKKANEKNKGKEKFYFLDGPPYTSGKVHLGTAWNKALKDSLLRYKRMKGFDVWDRAGYDMHGLPTENATMKKLGLKSKEDIAKNGIPGFIEECRNFCIENMKSMNNDFIKMGVWMDFENAYQSIAKDFMEAEWWLIKRAHEKGRLYEGLRTMTWCPVSESALAKHELEYRTVVDRSIFVKFKVKGEENAYLIIWTTTPWTIPFNLAIMVNPEENYVKAKVGDEIWIVASKLAGVFIQGVAGKKYSITEEIPGEALEGTEYEHPFHNELKEHYESIKKSSPKTHTVLLSKEYVDTSGGSGLVHCAPGCGPEDYEVGYRNGIPPFNNIDTKGLFPESMGKFSGMAAKKDDGKFIEALDEEGALIAETEVEHEYPHDWRHHMPVIFRTTKQWFFRVEDLKEKMVEENRAIKWVPEAAFNAFDSWLKNLRDNSISKQRFWGTPIPIWKNIEDENDYIVVGSAKELEELSGKNPEDLHIPSVDSIEIKKEGKTYRRIPDILDVWVDAGTASWNCLDYPKNKKNFEGLFPADFILEGKDQIRGWFNLLMIASTLAFGKPSFKSVYMHGFVQDSMGRKMSKSLGNYILPNEVVDEYGSDTLRYYLIGGANPGIDINYNFDDVKLKHKNLMVYWNLHRFLADLSINTGKSPENIDYEKAKKNFGAEEKYILSKLNSSIADITENLDSYRINEAPVKIEALFMELSRTYIQMIREKAASGTQEEKEAVLYTINRVFMGALKMFAIVSPFIAESMYQNLKKEFSFKEESIHLMGWPEQDSGMIDKALEKMMETAGSVIQALLAAREKLQSGVRWPLRRAFILTKKEDVISDVIAMQEIIKSQANIKEIKTVSSVPGVRTKIKADFAKLGPVLGEKTPAAIAKLSAESAESILSSIEKKGKFVLELGEEKTDILREHIIIEREIPKGIVEMEFRGGIAYLSSETDEELEAEGYAREIMRRVQSLRKKAGLQKPDKITLMIKAESEMAEMLVKMEKQISEKCGAEKIRISDEEPSRKHEHSSEEKIKSAKFSIFFDKVD